MRLSIPSFFFFALFTGLNVGAQPLKIHVINVQQGTSILVEGPGKKGKSLMFDFGKGQFADTELLPYLNSVGIKEGDKIHYGLVSHRDDDHYGGLDYLLSKKISFGKLIDNGSDKKYPSSKTWIHDQKIVGAQAGDTIELGGGALAIVVAVSGNMIDGYYNKNAKNENDKSIALLVKYGEFEFISAGDLGGGDSDKKCTGRQTSQKNIETSVCKALVNKKMISENGFEVMHVNHHGSESSTNAHYMNTISPKVAIISTGEAQKDYQHPRKDVVENVLLAKTRCVTVDPALVLQTDELDDLRNRSKISRAGYTVGDIVITTTGKNDFEVSANGQVQGGGSELRASRLPLRIELD